MEVFGKNQCNSVESVCKINSNETKFFKKVYKKIWVLLAIKFPKSFSKVQTV